MAKVKHATSVQGADEPGKSVQAQQWNEDHFISGVADQTSLDALSQRLSALPLDSLADVSAPSPTDGQVLKWNSAQGQWVAAADQTGGGGGSVTSDEVSALSVTDAALSGRVDSVANAVSIVSNALSNEISNRTSADNVVSAQAASALSQFASAESVRNAGLSSRVDSVANAVSVVSAALASEVSNRISSDNAVSTQAASAISHLQSVLSQRISALSVDALKDVSIASPTSAQVLKYFSASAEWRNATDATAGGGGSVTSDEVSAVSAQAASAISNEASLRSVGDAALSLRVESVLSNDISNLRSAVSTLSTKTSTLSVDIAAVSSRVDSVHSTLSQRLSALVLNSLADVSIATPTDGQALMFNSAAGQWVNSTPAGGGGGSVTSAEYISTQSIASHLASVVSNVSILSAPSGSVVAGLQSVLNTISNMFSNAFSAGSAMSQRLSERAPWSVAKHAVVSAVQSIQNSTPQDITSLLLSLEVGNYEIQGGIFYSTSVATAGLRLAISCPPMQSPAGWMIGHTTSAANQQSSPGIHGQANLPASATTTFLSVTSTVAGTPLAVAFRGMMRVSTAGTMRIKAGGVSSVATSPLHIMAGSYVRAFKLG